MNLNDFSMEVHQNAVNHGFCEHERSSAEILSLIHSEWSEALEEARAGRPNVWHKCEAPIEIGSCCENGGGVCGKPVCEYALDKDFMNPKPEGVAVELIDGCIRIFDYIGETGTKIHEAVTLKKLMRSVPDELLDCDLQTLVARLHWYTSRAYIWGDTPFTERIAQEQMSYLYEALAIACAWIQKQGIDPETLIREKHEFNKSRPYKHGKKF